MAIAHGNKPATSQGRQFCVDTRQTRQRAPFSSGLDRKPRPQRHTKQASPSCGALTVAKPQPVLQAFVSDPQPFSFSTYRDDGALSEISIADCLCQEAFQRQAELKQAEHQALHRSLQSSVNSTAAAPHPHVQVKHGLADLYLCTAVADISALLSLPVYVTLKLYQNCAGWSAIPPVALCCW